MVEIELDMDNLYLFDICNVSKLQLESRGILDCDDVKKLGMKYHDGEIMHCYREVEDVLYVGDLDDNDLSVNDHIDADEDLSESLNDSGFILFSEYVDI